MLLEGKVVLVTGASAGIGQATAVAAAREGADIAINYIGDDAAAERTIAAVKAFGRRGVAFKGDVADLETAKAFVTGAADALGRAGTRGYPLGHHQGRFPYPRHQPARRLCSGRHRARRESGGLGDP